MPEPILNVRDLKKYFEVKKGMLSEKSSTVYAVNGVSFDLLPGNTLGLVGESGCGKTTVGKVLVRLYEPTDGTITFDGVEYSGKVPSSNLLKLRRAMQMIFQDPFSSLNPRMTVFGIISEGMRAHGVKARNILKEKTRSILDMVGLSGDILNRYPHEFSGGQRQRIGIARALAVKPRVVIADEPISALDLSIQAQIINLLMDLQERLNLTYLFIAHDLRIIGYVSHQIAVMYLGTIVEMAPAAELIRDQLHPYTQALFFAIPGFEKGTQRKKQTLKGDVPSAMAPPSGCHFHPRCPHAYDLCKKEMPPLKNIDKGHLVACHLVN